ncbi:hypothetical protein HK099_005237 [Clydaea vesicula]|uniref:Uncharacterized protein n=1 Tax=Clydaea vesicula TaxID=447962 RepID=A0AAD5U9E9_9FUNG|nr:hypothetical protein HK099_005237 [Clydaea vesicula]KAJ3396973.1 hypothetical protein HDU92_001264 [Lobulomyces angularis]
MNNFAAKEFWSIVVGGSVLSLNAGFINVVTLAGVFTITVSHVTGNVTRIAITVFQGDWATLALVVSIMFSFMFGAFVSGVFVGDNKFRLGRTYGYALLLESTALFLSYYFLKKELILGEWCAAFACGLQNALATSYSGAVVRTTHMTGIVTDIGNILGQACRTDTNAELWRLKVHVPLLLSYIFGGLLGQAAYLGLHENSLLLPCFFTGAIGMVYLFLPFMNQATEILKESTKQMRLDGFRPIVEVRAIGDPRKVDKFQSVVGKDVDLEIKNFEKEMAIVNVAKMSSEKTLNIAKDNELQKSVEIKGISNDSNKSNNVGEEKSFVLQLKNLKNKDGSRIGGSKFDEGFLNDSSEVLVSKENN